MKINRPLLSAVIFLMHVMITLWYYSHPLIWLADPVNKNFAKLVFMGGGFLLMGTNFLLAVESKRFFHKEIIKGHSSFIISLGVLFTIHSSGVYCGTSPVQIEDVCIAIIFIFSIMLISASIHLGLFKKN